MDGQADRRTRYRRAIGALHANLRLQRELLWHPRLGLAGPRRSMVAAGNKVRRLARRRV